ncbi:hypothetical protein AGMMS50212_09900 [Spirochaetia bacterium]|nr:hypothetical protein AGMMS50212_09900 [Spirochaetia bacterium]
MKKDSSFKSPAPAAKKVIFTVVLLIIGALSFAPLSSMQKAYNSDNEKGLQNTLTQKTKQIFVVWGITRGASGLIALLQSVELSVSIGVGGSLNPMAWLSPVDNILDKVSDVCLYAIGAVLIEKFLLALSGWAAFRIIIPLCAILCIALIWLDKQKIAVKKIIAGVSLIGFSICIAVPLSVQVSCIIEKKIFVNEIDKTIREMQLKNADVENMQNDIEKQGFSPGRIITSITGFFTNAKNIADALISDVMNYIMIFILTTIIIPIITIAGLGCLTKSIVKTVI